MRRMRTMGLRKPECRWALGCERLAVWRVRSGCCGFVDLLCDQHRLVRIRFLADTPAMERRHGCGRPELGVTSEWSLIGEGSQR